MGAISLKGTSLSILEFATITQGNTAEFSFNQALALAQKAEDWGYKRFWLAEHHNMESIASSATAILIGFIAGGTQKIRVGSGGIMLPNHAPLVVAEQFGTLATLYPNRIDLGLGRAPGTDQLTAKALRRNHVETVDGFQQDVQDLLQYFSADNKQAKVRAIPGEGLDIPVYILGSSTFSAYLAAWLGLPYAFASHFAPTYLHEALAIYRENFRPSIYLSKPYDMAGVNVIAADSNEEAQRISTSFMQMAKGILTGKSMPLPPPVDNLNEVINEFELGALSQMTTYSFVGDTQTIAHKLSHFVQNTGVNELMVASHIFDPAARQKSYQLLSSLIK